MAKISSSKRIILEDLPSEQRSWFAKVTNTLNPYMEQCYQILTRGITIGDNLKAQKISATVEVSQTYPISIKYNLNEAPYALHVASIKEAVSSSQVVQNYSMNWYYENGNIKIYFAGLDAAKSYNVNLYTLV